MRRKEDKKAAMNDAVATTGRYHESRVEAAVKPLLRGYLHLGAALEPAALGDGRAVPADRLDRAGGDTRDRA
jgi:hypothetical protein